MNKQKKRTRSQPPHTQNSISILIVTTRREEIPQGKERERGARDKEERTDISVKQKEEREFEFLIEGIERMLIQYCVLFLTTSYSQLISILVYYG